MKETNRQRKNEISYKISLNEEQKLAKELIRNNQIVVVTGQAGSGKSLVCAQTALDFLYKKECDQIFVTRAMVEVGASMGFLPGNVDEKLNPYLEAFIDNLYKCSDRVRIDELVKSKSIQGFPVQFVRGKTIDDILIVEEAQNLSKQEMMAILTRLGKTGKIIVNGDNAQKDTRDQFTGLDFAIALAKDIEGIEWIKLQHNHRSDLVGKIIDYDNRK